VWEYLSINAVNRSLASEFIQALQFEDIWRNKAANSYSHQDSAKTFLLGSILQRWDSISDKRSWQEVKKGFGLKKIKIPKDTECDLWLNIALNGSSRVGDEVQHDPSRDHKSSTRHDPTRDQFDPTRIWPDPIRVDPTRLICFIKLVEIELELCMSSQPENLRLTRKDWKCQKIVLR